MSDLGYPAARTVEGHGEVLDFELEFYCKNCEDFRDVRKSDPDILCDTCHYVIATFHSREILRSGARTPFERGLVAGTTWEAEAIHRAEQAEAELNEYHSEGMVPAGAWAHDLARLKRAETALRALVEEVEREYGPQPEVPVMVQAKAALEAK